MSVGSACMKQEVVREDFVREINGRKIIMEDGRVCIKVAGFPGVDTPLWVLITEGCESAGVGRIAAIVPSGSTHKSWDIVSFRKAEGDAEYPTVVL